MLFQNTFNLELKGILGAIAGLIGGILLLVAFIKGLMWLWKNVIHPSKERLQERRTLRRQIAFAQFEIQWLMDHSSKPIFILDDKKQCTFVNEAMCLLLQRDSSDIEGSAWHQFIRDTELSGTLAKWDQAYAYQSPYNAVNQIIVGRKVVRFRVTAEPFLWNGKVRNYLGTMEYYDVEGAAGVDPYLLGE